MDSSANQRRRGLNAGRLCRRAICALLLAHELPGHALQPSTPLASYGRQAWLMENGLPQNTVQSLAQTSDGFLWMGTEAGLVRFDGSQFAIFDRNSTPALPGNDVRCLLAAEDGSLWIGTGDGLARMKQGAVATWTVANGLPGNEVRSLGLDSDGKIRVSTQSGSASVTGDRVASIDSADFKRQNPAIVDSASLTGGLWAQATSTVVTLGHEDKIDARFAVRQQLPGTRVQRLLSDRNGALWIGTNRGLARWAGGNLEEFPVTDPLSRASVISILEDREGNLWVGTETDGLHILRDQRFRIYGTREGVSSDATSTVVEDANGKLWVGTTGGGLNALHRNVQKPGQTSIDPIPDVLLSSVILSLAAAPNGDLWVGTPDGLNRIRGSAVDSFTSADGLPDDFIRSLHSDADGSLWIGTRRGLSHWTFHPGGASAARLAPQIANYTQANGLGSDLVGAMARDTNGDLWIATFAGLSRISDGKIVNFTVADGLSSNVITALLPRPMGRMLIGTQDRGWNLWDGRHFLRVTGNGLDRTSIRAILDDGIGHLWFATGNGIARCDCTEGARGMATASCSRWMEFGTADGLRSREMATNSHPSAWRAHDGTLWFATPKGLVEVDPAHFPINSVPSPVAIERFAVDDADAALHPANAPLRVKAGHSHFEFDYAGLSFVAPQKVRYRYMLQGFDHAWTEAGARRTAYYTNIPPGAYTFRVQAANNDGVWNEAGAELPFELAPRFHQTAWFYVLVLAAAAGLVFLFLRLRLLRAEREFKAVLGERNRIAREIHDTLAQGYVGISVQLEVLAELLRLKKVDAAERQLDKTRGHVREGLADARQSIWALRSQDARETTLPVRMQRMVEGAGSNGFRSKFSLFGAYRPLPAEIEREFVRVAQEALHNVSKHAHASNVAVQLEYGADRVALEVRDDGSGFSAGAEPVSPPGHFGLTGMRERAAAMGGTLHVASEPGAGTTVRLEAPAQREKKE